jgi:hypothetical protein
MIAEVQYADGTSERAVVANQSEANSWVKDKKATPKAGTFVWSARYGETLPVLSSPPPPPPLAQLIRK